jgi:FkbM family methyltransferase
MKFPNFFIAGAAKSGTTSLWRYLLQHPDIFMPSDIMYKEPAYFSDIKGMKDLNEYLSLFKNVTTEKMIGEASAAYLTSPESPERIREVVPDAKFIIMLRNPIDRAYSLYNWMACNGYEPIEIFEQALEIEETNRYENESFKNSNPEYYYNYLYFHSGLYSDQIKRFLNSFRREQFYFVIFEKFKAQIPQEIRKIFKFLDVDADFISDVEIHNEGKVPYSAALQFFIRQRLIKYLESPYKNPHPLKNEVIAKLMELNTQIKKPNAMDDKTRDQLAERYIEDVSKLSQLIDDNLYHWWPEFEKKNSGKSKVQTETAGQLTTNKIQDCGLNSPDTKSFIPTNKLSLLEQDITINDLIEKSAIDPRYEIDNQAKINFEQSLDRIINDLEKNLSNYPRKIPGHLKVGDCLIHYADLQSFYYQARQIFKSKLYDFFSDVDDPVIIDGGAHIGLASIYFSKKFPNSTIYAYEADPNIAKLLKENIKSFNLQNVKAFSKAIWKDDKGVFFKNSGDDSGYVYNFNTGPGIRVPSIRLRNILEQNKIEFLKLDVEGSEYDVVEDCDGALTNVKKIIVEVHSFNTSENSLGRLLKVLENNDFYYTLGDLHSAEWLGTNVKPPFRAVNCDKYIITVFAWQKTAGKIFRNHFDNKKKNPKFYLNANRAIVQLCAHDYGGAGKAAHRLHTALKKNGVTSKMLVANKKTTDPSVKILFPGSPDPLNQTINLHSSKTSFWSQQLLRWQNELAKYPNRSAGLEIFTDALSDYHLEQIQEVKDADLIQLHWVAGILDYPSMPLQLKNKHVVWTLHDMNPFTGGCHYSGGCEKYKKRCGACPQLGSAIENDLSRQIWKLKYDAFQNLNLNIVTPSKWLAECATQSSLLSDYPVEVIPNGLPIDTFRPSNKTEIRETLNIPDNAKIILFGAASLDNERKGFRYLMEALNRFAHRIGDDAALLTFGNFPAGLQISSSHPIYNLGSISSENQLALAYSTADVFVIPSLEDNLPNTVIEAMACAVPVVGFNVGGIPDMIEHKKTGYLAEPKNAHSLAQGIEWVLLLPERYAELSKNCRAKVEKRYALEVQAKAYNRLYEGILANQQKIHTNIEELIKKGEEFFHQGNLGEARIKFSEALAIDSKRALVHNNLAVVYHKMNDKEKAEIHYTKAIQLDPENTEFKKNLADFYYVELRRYEDAIQIFIDLLKANPNDIATLLIMGNICAALGNRKYAVNFYQSVLKIEPLNEYAREGLNRLQDNVHGTQELQPAEELYQNII